MVPAELVLIVIGFLGAAAGGILGQWAHWRLEARRFAARAARVEAAPYDWRRDGI